MDPIHVGEEVHIRGARLVALGLIGVLTLAGCQQQASPAPEGALQVAPAAATVAPGSQQQFTAQSPWGSDVTWAVSLPTCGTITASGLFTASLTPTEPSGICTVVATLKSDPSKVGLAVVIVQIEPPVAAVSASGRQQSADGLSVAQGGTGSTTLTANGVLLGNGTSALQAVSPSTSGNVLTSTGTTWTSQAPLASDASNNTRGGTGALAGTNGVSNTAVGASALNALAFTAGNASRNSALGHSALMQVTTGSDNTATGYQAGYRFTTASGNTAVGTQSLFSATTSSQNTASGYQALYGQTSGANNTGVGYTAGTTNATGSSNTFVGHTADATTSVSSTTVVGAAARSGADQATAIGATASASAANALALGYGATNSTANSAVIGNSSVTAVNPGATDVATLGTAANRWKALYALVTVNAQTGTTYTLAAADLNAFVTAENASAITLTVPANASVALPVGFQCTVLQKGTGAVTFTGGAGVTFVTTASNRATNNKGSAATLIKIGSDQWALMGDLN